MMVLVSVLLIIIFFFGAVVVDHGYTSVTKAALQSAADVGSYTGVDVLADESRLNGEAAAEALAVEATAAALQMVAENWPDELSFDPTTDVQVTLGRIAANGDFQPSDPAVATAVSVEVLASDVSMFFAPVLGTSAKKVAANAAASFSEDIAEIRINTPGGRAPVLPLTVHIDIWRNALSEFRTDRYRWDSDYERFSTGPDGFGEFDIFTGEHNSSGNFGTLNIGRNSNGMPELLDQIEHGATEAQLARYGGALTLDPTSGRLEIAGDPGLGGPVYNAIDDIVGETRLIPVFDSVTGNGANTRYSIVGFAGVRIVEANGRGGNKYIRIQPALVRDSSFVAGTSSSSFETWGVLSATQLTK